MKLPVQRTRCHLIAHADQPRRPTALQRTWAGPGSRVPALPSLLLVASSKLPVHRPVGRVSSHGASPWMGGGRGGRTQNSDLGRVAHPQELRPPTAWNPGRWRRRRRGDERRDALKTLLKWKGAHRGVLRGGPGAPPSRCKTQLRWGRARRCHRLQLTLVCTESRWWVRGHGPGKAGLTS